MEGDGGDEGDEEVDEGAGGQRRGRQGGRQGASRKLRPGEDAFMSLDDMERFMEQAEEAAAREDDDDEDEGDEGDEYDEDEVGGPAGERQAMLCCLQYCAPPHMVT